MLGELGARGWSVTVVATPLDGDGRAPFGVEVSARRGQLHVCVVAETVQFAALFVHQQCVQLD